MEDKNLENLFTQLDAEPQTEAGTDPGDNKERVKLEVEQILASKDWTETEKRMLQATKFLHDLEYVLVERDLIRRGVISAEEPELTEQDIAEAGEKLKAYIARDEAIREEIKRRGGRGIKVPAPDWMKERAKRGDVKLNPEDFIEISKYIAEYYLNALKKKDEAEPEPPEVTKQEELEQLAADEAKGIEHIKYKPRYDLKTVTDKFPKVFFSMPMDSAINGQMKWIPMGYGKAESGKEIDLFYSYNFNEPVLKKAGIIPQMTPFDYFLSVVCDNLYEAGNRRASLAKIYKELGYTGNANKERKQEIYDGFVKCGSTILDVDDREVMTAYGKGTYHSISTYVIPVQLCAEKYMANGRIADLQVNIMGFSAFRILGERLGRVTAWPKDFLTRYEGKRTKKYWAVLQYALSEIGWMMKGTRTGGTKIVFKTLYDFVGDKTDKQERATQDVLRGVLEMFKKKGDREYYIEGFRDSRRGEPGIEIIFKSGVIQAPAKKKKRLPKKNS